MSVCVVFCQCFFFLVPLSSALRLSSQDDEATAVSRSAELPNVAAMLCSNFERPKVAVCLHGAARSFPTPLVHRSQQTNLIDALGADVTTFLHLTKADSRSDERSCCNGHFPEATDKSIQEAADYMKIPENRMKITDGPHFELPNCSNYQSNYDERKRNKQQNFAGMPGMYSLAGQLSHKEGCMNLIREEEKRTNTMFDEVILSRADLTFYAPMQPYCFFKHAANRKYYDWYYHVQRKDADKMFSTTYNAFYGCKKALSVGELLEKYVVSNAGMKLPEDDKKLHVLVTRRDQPDMPTNVCVNFHTFYSEEVPTHGKTQWVSTDLCGLVTYKNKFLNVTS